MADVRARVLISGRVQGVYFRAYTRDMAESLGLRGWVRNLPDGRVEAFFSGPQKVVDKAIAWCHKGSPSARVDKVETAWEAAAEELKRFTVRY